MLVQWHGFTEGNWTKEVNVRDFIQKNYTPYEGNAEFLTAPTEKTQQLWHKVLALMKQEREKGVLDVDTKVPTSITAHAAGYIDRDLEQIVGLLSRSTFETRDYALWRDSRCQGRFRSLRLSARSANRRNIYEISQNSQRYRRF
jgi:pyruvate-formate lyase